MLYQLGNKIPRLPQQCYIAPNATLIGDIEIAKDVSIWFNVVIRADMAKVSIDENTNVQDGSILHVDEGFPLQLGKNVTVGHKVMLHGCTIEDNSLIGMNAVILNGAKIGKNCLIGANALVTENMVIPDGHLVLGSPAKIIKALDEDTIRQLQASADHYVKNGQYYNLELKAITR